MNRIRVRLVGCGGRDAGDDSVGLILAERLRRRPSGDIEIRTAPGGGADLLRWCEAVETLVILDAAAATPEFPVGQMRRFSYPADRACLESLAFPGTHALGIVPALKLAEELGQLPPRVLIYAIAGDRFERGATVSSAIQLALDELEDRLGQDLNEV